MSAFFILLMLLPQAASPGPQKPIDRAPQRSTSASPSPASTRGRKLMLKDGSYQVVRNYEIKGERVRYYSLERAGWEEIPASMVDWDATKKAELTEEKADATLLGKAHVEDEVAKAETPVDVDESLTVAKGVFLPDGEGMFVLEGKSVKALAQVVSQAKTDRKTALKQVLTPIPIIAGKKNVEIPGARAAVRIRTSMPEFYLREPPPDPDRRSSIERSGLQNQSGPEVTLVRAKVKGNKRLLESIRSYFGQEIGEERDEIAVQRWEVAPDVFRFTLSEPLPPGEYALAELLDDGLNLFVWDFAVDASAPAQPVSR